MKKLITSALLLLLTVASYAQCPTNPSVAHPDTVELGLQIQKVIDFTRIETRYNSTTGIVDTFLVIPGCCFVFNHDLRIPANDTTGVHLSANGSTMMVPDYYYVEVEGCLLEAYDSKEEFYLVSATQYPYEVRGGKIDNILARGAYDYNPLDWERLKAAGQPSAYTFWSDTAQAWIPDTMPFFKPPMTCDDPYSDHVTGVTETYTDCYSSNNFLINGIGDGVFPAIIGINLPATQYDPGMYPNFYEHNFRKTGVAFEWTDDPAPDCCHDPVPATPANLKIRNTTLSWDTVSHAHEYYVYVEMAYTTDNGKKILGWYAPHLMTEVYGNAITIPALPVGIYRYSVSAENCAGESPRSEPTRKDNQ